MIVALVALAVSTPNATLQRSIKSHFDAELLDGLSARWKWPAQRSPTMYCGWVNAKNRMGAYTGWTPFAVLIEKGKVKNGRLIGEPGVVNEIYAGGCTKAGYDINEPPRD